MKALFTFIFLLLLPIYGSANSTLSAIQTSSSLEETSQQKASLNQKLYREMKLKNKISYAAFDQAMTGYNKLNAKNKDIITVIDFSKPSTEERLYILDMKNKQILKSSVVSHGQNSGDNYATSFSNLEGSHKSSLGFYVTETTYQGRNGYSLVLDGLENGINDKAKERAIVMHGANYADPSVITSNGRLGRSFGCPALPQSVNKEIIDTIKGGSLLYIYANDNSYLQNSELIKQTV